MNKMFKSMAAAWIIFALLPAGTGLVSAGTEVDYTLDGEAKVAVLDSICRMLIDEYIFLDVAEKMVDHVQGKLHDGAYDAIDEPSEFASRLRADLWSVSKDNHFFLEFNPDRAALLRAGASISEEERIEAAETMLQADRRINFGFEKLERLDGNVGYLDIRLFCDPNTGGDTAAGAMGMLANSDAVIIDLRDTPGGNPDMVQLICSYFVRGAGGSRVHLNSFERRHTDKTEQYWTLPHVPGKTMFDVDLYVLISRNTGSGAEEFAYNMKNLKRATLVGETTRGSAHPVDFRIVAEHYVFHLPNGRPVNPVSGTNWERVGVKPDVKAPANHGLDKAHHLALEKLSGNVKDDNQKHHINWALAGLEAKLNPVHPDAARLAAFAGEYGVSTVSLEEGSLMYRSRSRTYKLTHLWKNIFAVEGVDGYRVEFVPDGEGKATGLYGLYFDGMNEYRSRN